MAQLAYKISNAARDKRMPRIPESHALYVCPNSCGRRQGLRALRNGEANHVSFLRLSQADVVSGDYEGQVAEAVAQLLDTLRPAPRVLALYVNCIDDFLGTDTDSLLEDLRARFPQVRFTLTHINPVARDVAGSPAVAMQQRLYGQLDAPDPASRDAGVTLLGAFEPPDERCELWGVLDALGARPVRQLARCETFNEYQGLARSCLTLSLSHLGEGPAAQFQERFGTPGFSWHAAYCLEEVEQRYEQLADMLLAVTGAGVLGLADDARDEMAALLAPARSAAARAVAQAREAVGELPVAVDSAASMMPFTLANDLLGYGFNVMAVFALHLKGCDDAAEARLLAEHPEVAVVRTESVEAISGYGFPQECLAIGQDAAFLLHASHAVDLYHDEGCFGYQGIGRLMDAMAAAVGKGGA